jgi:hypothetical protein
MAGQYSLQNVLAPGQRKDTGEDYPLSMSPRLGDPIEMGKYLLIASRPLSLYPLTRQLGIVDVTTAEALFERYLISAII